MWAAPVNLKIQHQTKLSGYYLEDLDIQSIQNKEHLKNNIDIEKLYIIFVGFDHTIVNLYIFFKERLQK